MGLFEIVSAVVLVLAAFELGAWHQRNQINRTASAAFTGMMLGYIRQVRKALPRHGRPLTIAEIDNAFEAVEKEIEERQWVIEFKQGGDES